MIERLELLRAKAVERMRRIRTVREGFKRGEIPNDNMDAFTTAVMEIAGRLSRRDNLYFTQAALMVMESRFDLYTATTTWQIDRIEQTRNEFGGNSEELRMVVEDIEQFWTVTLSEDCWEYELGVRF